MLEALMGLIIGTIPVLAWLCGYFYGKADGIREVRHLMNEQWKDYESFRDLVFQMAQATTTTAPTGAVTFTGDDK